MSRKVAHLNPVAPETWDTTDIGQAGGRERFADIRDTVRTAWASMGVVVGDICTWTSGSFEGMMFECFSTSTNQAFYVIGGTSSSTQAPDIDEYLGQTGTNVRTRVKALGVAFASASTAPNAGLVLGLNPDTSISRADLEYDNAAALTYTGGDYTALVTLNPDSLAGLQEIFPAHATYAMSTDLEGAYHVSHALAYDDVTNVWMYVMSGTSANELNIAMWGELLDPSGGGDTNEYATLYVHGTMATTQNGRGISHTHAEVNAFNGSGVSQDYDMSPTETLDTLNYKVSGGVDDGKFNWRKVLVDNGTGGSGEKGHVKEELFVEIGAYRHGSFKLRPIQFDDAEKPVICYTESCAIWWEAGARMFPSYTEFNP